MSTDGAAQVAADQVNFLQALVGGRLGLAATYWLFGLLASLVGYAIVHLAATVLPDDRMSKIMVLVFALILLVYTFLVSVGTWRAARRYKGLRLWVILAKIQVVLYFFFVALTVIAFIFFGVEVRASTA